MLETVQALPTQPALENNSPMGKPGEKPASKQTISKPVVVFGVAGILIGLSVIGYTMFLKPQDTPPIVQPPIQQPPQQLMLTLESPTDGTLAVENEILVQGTTTPGATVAVFTETEETIIETDPDGRFETTVQLSPGINSLIVTAYLEDGQEKTITLNVVYDNEV